MHKQGECDCESCKAVRQLWHAVATLENEEKLLVDTNGELAIAERVRDVIRYRGGNVSLMFDERLKMHREVETVEEEIKRTMGRILGEGDPDVEIREIRTGTDEVKRFEVTVKRHELEDARTETETESEARD